MVDPIRVRRTHRGFRQTGLPSMNPLSNLTTVHPDVEHLRPIQYGEDGRVDRRFITAGATIWRLSRGIRRFESQIAYEMRATEHYPASFAGVSVRRRHFTYAAAVRSVHDGMKGIANGTRRTVRYSISYREETR